LDRPTFSNAATMSSGDWLRIEPDVVMLICGAQNLREISLFPMNQRAEDLLMGAPSLPRPGHDTKRADATSGARPFL
jgi:hypothetical protein